MSSTELNKVLCRAVLSLLKPLVRILLRNGVSFGQFTDLAKRAYVEVASDEFSIPGKPQTTSRISTITGLTRKDVQRLRNESLDSDVGASAKYSRAARVINAWISESAYLDQQGMPVFLPFEGPAPSFAALVKEASGDITARTILDELIHIGAVKQLDDGQLKLLVRAYIPMADDVEKIGILGTDVSDLISTIDHNLGRKQGQAYFQRKVCYDNLPQEVMDELRDTIAEKAQAALESMNEDMAKCDRDRDRKIKGSGRVRAGLGIFYFQGEVKSQDQGKE